MYRMKCAVSNFNNVFGVATSEHRCDMIYMKMMVWRLINDLLVVDVFVTTSEHRCGIIYIY